MSGRHARAVRLALSVSGVLLAGLATAATAGAATNPPTFARADHAFFGNFPVAADLNGDSRPDLVGWGAQVAAVMLNTGSGAFGPRSEYPVASGIQSVTTGDFNGDGRTDIAATVNDRQLAGAVLIGNGDGTFQPPVHFANTAAADSPAIVATDLNNDARTDLVIAHQMACYTAPCVVSETLSVMLGNGDGTFEPTRDIQVGRGMAWIAVGDFNRDSVRDLAIAGDSSRVYRLLGNGDGTFAQQPTITLTADTLGVDGTDIKVADFNRDGIQDLVVAIGLNGSRTAILIGNGDGSFRSPLILTDPGLNVPTYVAVGDYNGDGFADLALAQANGNSGLMQIRNGNGDGTFQGPVQFLRPPDRSSLGTVGIGSGQLNADTRPDLFLSIGGAAPSFAVLLNTTGVAPPPTPSAPSLVSPSQDATPAQPAAFDWSDVSAASSYRIQIDDSSSFSTPIVVDRTTSVSQFTAPTLAARQHWWRVRGINSAGTAGAWSAVRRFTPRATTSPPPPPPPPPPPGESATLTVTATGRSGERVTSSPAGISVSVGTTGSASFTTGSAITLSISNGRDAIWSGGCSSGGSKQRSCSLTLNGSAAVTANVQ